MQGHIFSFCFFFAFMAAHFNSGFVKEVFYFEKVSALFTGFSLVSSKTFTQGQFFVVLLRARAKFMFILLNMLNPSYLLNGVCCFLKLPMRFGMSKVL